MIKSFGFLWLVSHSPQLVTAVTYNVPSSPPSNASPVLDPAPVGVSLEFFTFPNYMQNVTSTMTCLRNFRDLTGSWPPIRIGGTTQDRATYNAQSSAAVTYSVSNPADAPMSLTFGSSFFDLAASYPGKVIIGLNRRLNNLANTLAASRLALQKMKNLDSIELGNEPNFYTHSDPIAGGTWNAARDRSSQIEWQRALASNLSTSNIISAGVFFGTDNFNNTNLAREEGNAMTTVKNFNSHNYPQWAGTYNLTRLMSHSAIATQISPFKTEAMAAKASGKEYIIGETNSATQGGGGISPTFGAALWIVDYVAQSLLLGVKSIYFHQGTIGNCQYCWWGRYSMGNPYYGAYFITAALSEAERIAPLDNFSNNFGGYAIYKGNKPVRVLLINSNYYESGTRSRESFTLTGLPSSITSVRSRRLTGDSATSRSDRSSPATFGGQTFQDGTCVKQGTEKIEEASVRAGSVTLTLAASEALLVYL
ncbi:family 79 putative glycoside hydrolase [Triangularia setosa]|uniref:Family 79 putative glycoside hydrolase n=1 Tax=Triangularia setosa TaxID=2587417 RepID=A0AAN6W0E2_9PEZI|nr:family 79 putative glycoside hydrolase [Podospora setosa]